MQDKYDTSEDNISEDVIHAPRLTAELDNILLDLHILHSLIQ